MCRFRILHLRASNFIGGPEQQLLRYAESERGGQFEIYLGSFVGATEGSDFLRAAEARGLQVLSFPARNFGPRSALPMLVRAVKSQEIDLLCTHGFKADVLGVLAGLSTQVRVACFLRGWTGEDHKVRIYEVADRFSLRFADRIICLSDSQAGRLCKRTTLAHKVRIVRNAIDVPAIDEKCRSRSRNEVRRRFTLPKSCRVVATAGRLSPEKGISDFLEASATVSHQFPDVRFLVFGDGVLRQQLEQKTQELGIRQRVMFAGFARDLRSLLPGIDLLVNPSHSEEMPNIVLEAMAAEVPVIATAVGGVSEIAGSERAVYLVPPKSPRILADVISELLAQPDRARALAQLGRSRVENTYSPPRQVAEMHSLYQDILGNQLRGQPAADARSTNEDSRLSDAGHRPPLPFLSIVVPVRNEELHLRALLADLDCQDYPKDRFEVLIVDAISTDGTSRIVEEFAEHSSLALRLLQNPRSLSSAGRNVGVRNASGEYVLFIDGHSQIPSAQLLRDTADLFERTQAECLCRPQPLLLPGNSPFQDVVAHVRGTSLGHDRDSTIYETQWEGPVNPCSSGALYRKPVFERIGFYDEDFDACEDVEFNYRVFQAGLSSYFSPRLSVGYRPRATLKGLWQQMVRYGRGRCRLAAKHSGASSLSQVIPAGLLAWTILGGVASLLSRRFAPYYLGTQLVYILLVLGYSARLGWRYGWRHFVQAPFLYFVIHFGLGAGFFKEAFSKMLGGYSSAVDVESICPLPGPSTTGAMTHSEPVQRPGVPHV